MKGVQSKNYNVVIVGGGITGASLLYVLSRYTNIPRLVLIEKYNEIAHVNSHFNNNSQTLHFGDIETNYSLEKARRVKEAAEMLKRYLEQYARGAFRKGYKMVLAVGESEVAELERRYEEFLPLFPKLKKINREEIARLEPRVVKGRNQNEKILALFTEDGYAVNFKKLAESFIRESRSVEKEGKQIDIVLDTEVADIVKSDDGYRLETSREVFTTDAVVVAAGPHSLIFAHSLGYGKEFGILPVAGSFYLANNVLNGKVYTMQIKKLPFAAIHGDPDVDNPQETRFGPTAKVLPLLERHKYRTALDFLQTSVWNVRGVRSLMKIISDKTIFFYVLKNILYDLPIIGKRIFLKEAKKIVPLLEISELRYGRGIGGIRPQVVNTITKKLEMGEAKITGNRIIFNITPSPGASVSLKNAEQDALQVVSMLGAPFQFYEKRWCEDIGSSMVECRE